MITMTEETTNNYSESSNSDDSSGNSNNNNTNLGNDDNDTNDKKTVASSDAGAYLVVRIRGQADVPYWATYTMSILKLERKYRATILPAKDNTLGMLNKIKHYVAWTILDEDLARELLEKKARKSGYKKVSQDDISKLGFDDLTHLARDLANGVATLSKLAPLKPWFALAPPRHGFRRSTKRLAGQKGILGNNRDLGDLVRRMMIV